MRYLQVPVPELPNASQWMALLRVIAPFIGGLLVAHGVMSATAYDSLINQVGTVLSDVTVLAGMLAPIATAVWGMLQHTDAKAVQAAAEVPGVQVTVTPAAAENVKAAVPDLTKS